MLRTLSTPSLIMSSKLVFLYKLRKGVSILAECIVKTSVKMVKSQIRIQPNIRLYHILGNLRGTKFSHINQKLCSQSKICMAGSVLHDIPTSEFITALAIGPASGFTKFQRVIFCAGWALPRYLQTHCFFSGPRWRSVILVSHEQWGLTVTTTRRPREEGGQWNGT